MGIAMAIACAISSVYGVVAICGISLTRRMEADHTMGKKAMLVIIKSRICLFVGRLDLGNTYNLFSMNAHTKAKI